MSSTAISPIPTSTKPTLRILRTPTIQMRIPGRITITGRDTRRLSMAWDTPGLVVGLHAPTALAVGEACDRADSVVSMAADSVDSMGAVSMEVDDASEIAQDE